MDAPMGYEKLANFRLYTACKISLPNYASNLRLRMNYSSEHSKKLNMTNQYGNIRYLYG